MGRDEGAVWARGCGVRVEEVRVGGGRKVEVCPKDQPLIDHFAAPFVSADIVRFRIMNVQDIGEFVAVLPNL